MKTKNPARGMRVGERNTTNATVENSDNGDGDMWKTELASRHLDALATLLQCEKCPFANAYFTIGSRRIQLFQDLK
jgi:hypothetical protein